MNSQHNHSSSSIFPPENVENKIGVWFFNLKMQKMNKN